MALRIAVDTNRYSDLMAGDAALADTLERADAVFLPFIVLGELRSGFGVGEKTASNEAALTRFMTADGVHALHPDDDTTRHYAELYRQLRARGTKIPTNDLWIAALVVQHDLVLCTRDAHFAHLPQLVVA